MPRYRYLSLFVLVFAFFVGGLFIFKEQFSRDSKVTEKMPMLSETQLVEMSEEQTNQFSYVCQAGKSAFEELQIHAKIETQNSSFGPMVTAINGVNQGDGRYWLYAIDGQEATMGASIYICKGGEQISWELK